MEMKIDHEIHLADAIKMAKSNELIRYGANTMWWGMDDAPWYTKPGIGLPCDPRGGMLFQTEDSLGFIRSAQANPDHYGKHGLRAFLLALHGCVVTPNGLPTCFDSWQQYNDLIDSQNEGNSEGRVTE